MNKFSIFIICLSLIYVTEAGIRCSLGQWACDASCAGTLRSHGICDDDGECICQAPVSITNLSRCNLGEDACNVFCTATGHVNGTCEEEEVNYFLNQILNVLATSRI